MGLLFKTLPPPPRMSRSQYFRYRLRLLSLTVLWLCGILVAVFFYEQLNAAVKVLLAILSLIFIPDIGIIEGLFVSYKQYLRRGL